MSAGKWTEGPWETASFVDARYLNGIGEVTLIRRNGERDDRYVAMATLDCMVGERGPKTTRDEREANAHLIAAAPDLYEALAELIAEHPVYRNHPAGSAGSAARMAQVRAITAEDKALVALTKARGES